MPRHHYCYPDHDARRLGVLHVDLDDECADVDCPRQHFHVIPDNVHHTSVTAALDLALALVQRANDDINHNDGDAVFDDDDDLVGDEPAAGPFDDADAEPAEHGG